MIKCIKICSSNIGFYRYEINLQRCAKEAHTGKFAENLIDLLHAFFAMHINLQLHHQFLYIKIQAHHVGPNKRTLLSSNKFVENQAPECVRKSSKEEAAMNRKINFLNKRSLQTHIFQKDMKKKRWHPRTFCAMAADPKLKSEADMWIIEETQEVIYNQWNKGSRG